MRKNLQNPDFPRGDSSIPWEQKNPKKTKQRNKFGSVWTLRGTFTKQQWIRLNYPAVAIPSMGERKAVSAWLTVRGAVMWDLYDWGYGGLGRSQIRPSKGIKGMQFLLIVLWNSAHKPLGVIHPRIIPLGPQAPSHPKG